MLIVSGQVLAGGIQKKDNLRWCAETFGERGQESPCLSGNSEATIILCKQPRHRQPVIQAASGLATLTFGERGLASPCLSGNSEATIILYKQPQHRQLVIQAASGVAPLTFGERGQASPCLCGNSEAIHRHVSPASLRFKV